MQESRLVLRPGPRYGKGTYTPAAVTFSLERTAHAAAPSDACARQPISSLVEYLSMVLTHALGPATGRRPDRQFMFQCGTMWLVYRQGLSVGLSNRNGCFLESAGRCDVSAGQGLRA